MNETSRPPWIATLLALCAAASSGCGGHASSNDEVGGIALGSYRVVLAVPGGDLPFGLDLERKAGALTGHLVNGTERIELSEVIAHDGRLDIAMPGYETRLTATRRGDVLEGELTLDKSGGRIQHVPLTARLGQPYRFFAETTSTTSASTTPQARSADVSGRWAVTFHDDATGPEAAVGEFSQSGDTVSGTFLTDSGDHRYLAGQVHGDELYLSAFDGAHVFLYKAKIGAAGGLDGDFWSGMAYHETWTAARDARASLPDAYTLTRMKPGAQRLEFSFPDLNGNTISSNDPEFKDKVIVVALAGSWCPNCHDEAAFLAPLYRKYRGRGLEVVSLMFEHFGDFAQAAAATQRFRQHYGIDYTTLIAGVSDRDDAARKLPSLAGVHAFPTTLFIDRKGVVRKIHTGFSGPATGEHYTQFVEEFKQTLDQLLAES